MLRRSGPDLSPRCHRPACSRRCHRGGGRSLRPARCARKQCGLWQYRLDRGHTPRRHPRQIETNLFGVINVTKAAIPVLRQQGSGHIIQLSSIGGGVGAMGRAAYSAAKWGVEGFSEALARGRRPSASRCRSSNREVLTDFAGSSTTINEGRPEYDSTVGAAARFQRNYNGPNRAIPPKQQP